MTSLCIDLYFYSLMNFAVVKTQNFKFKDQVGFVQ